MGELIVKEEITNENILAYLDAFGLSNKLEQKEKIQFLEVSKAYQLNPFKREIYCLPYGEGDKRKLSIITGFEVYLKRAERSGFLDGWRVWTEGSSKPVVETKSFEGKNGSYKKTVTTWAGDLKAIIEIFRKDRSRPFIHEVLMSEYGLDSPIWISKPVTMIKKVAMAQGFRLCFPDELGGIPYTADELPLEMSLQKNANPETFEDPAFSKIVEPETVEVKKAQEEPEDENFTEWKSLRRQFVSLAKDWPEAEKAEYRDKLAPDYFKKNGAENSLEVMRVMVETATIKNEEALNSKDVDPKKDARAELLKTQISELLKDRPEGVKAFISDQVEKAGDNVKTLEEIKTNLMDTPTSKVTVNSPAPQLDIPDETNQQGLF